MKYCKICGEELDQQEISFKICKECEAAVAKKVSQKIVEGVYPKKAAIRVF